MPSNRSLTEAERAFIVSKVESGSSYRQISSNILLSVCYIIILDILGVSLGCISLTMKKYRETGKFSDSEHAGRPTKLTSRDKRQVENYFINW